jgi:hypothetical protein
MPRWWWEEQISHHHHMQATCEAHGDLTGEKTYRQAIERAEQWLGKLDGMRQSNTKAPSRAVSQN